MKKFLKILRISLKTVVIIAAICIAAFIAFIVFATIRDYKPGAITKLTVEKPARISILNKTEFSLLTWNIGYCGLGREMDFFYDGGNKVRPSEEDYQKYLNGVFNFVAKYDSIDFILLQEVDTNSRRTYYSNQADILKDDLPVHTSTYACNYRADFVPMPVTNPMGKVESGMMSFSRFAPSCAQRFSFPLNYAWPMRLFMLDRCFIMERFALPGGKDLIIINTHNSSFDDAGIMRLYELWMLRSIMLAEYEKGNYVIAGGDWNQNPADYGDRSFKGNFKKKPWKNAIERDFLPPDWQWAYDPLYPTNREVYEKYSAGSTVTQTLDFFVASPNLAVDEVSVIQSDFEFSDHQPVYLKVHMIENPLQLTPQQYLDTLRSLQDSLQKLNNKLDKDRGGAPNVKKPQDRFYLRK